MNIVNSLVTTPSAVFPKIDSIDSIDSIGNNLSTSSPDFGDFLASSLNNLNDQYLQVNESQKQFAAGNIETHELMTTLRETELMMKTSTTIRNKVLDAYKEITNMQI